jgi:CheY-like chemotaxis protein
MPILSVFSAGYCSADDLVQKAAKTLGYGVLDAEIFRRAEESSGIPAAKLSQAMTGPPFAFNKFTHKREKCIATLRLVLSEALLGDGFVLHGFASHLVPKTIKHVLRVCLVADSESRTRQLQSERGISAREALALVRDSDAQRLQWTDYLFNLPPWDKSLYDLKIPLQSLSADDALRMMEEGAASGALRPTGDSLRAVRDFNLEARARLRLIGAGHYHAVSVQDGTATVLVDEYSLRLEHLEGEILQSLAGLEGLEEVLVKTGPNYRPPSVYSNVEIDLPEKVLLVDDEKDFALTLSERLQMRNLDPAIAYDGEEALGILGEVEPEVMVLDLKMPGIDGIEVLRRTKAEHPEVEVIILTGHGSEKDRDLCMELGAFAYIEKPADIEVLSRTMKEAAGKIRARRGGADGEHPI